MKGENWLFTYLLAIKIPALNVFKFKIIYEICLFLI